MSSRIFPACAGFRLACSFALLALFLFGNASKSNEQTVVTIPDIPVATSVYADSTVNEAYVLNSTLPTTSSQPPNNLVYINGAKDMVDGNCALPNTYNGTPPGNTWNSVITDGANQQIYVLGTSVPAPASPAPYPTQELLTFDASAGTCTPLFPLLPLQNLAGALTALDSTHHKLYLIGNDGINPGPGAGINSSGLDVVDTTNSTDTLVPLPQKGVFEATGIVVDPVSGYVYMVGNNVAPNNFLDLMYIYNPSTGSVTEVILPFPAYSLFLVPDSKPVLLAFTGGENNPNTPTPVVSLLAPSIIDMTQSVVTLSASQFTSIVTGAAGVGAVGPVLDGQTSTLYFQTNSSGSNSSLVLASVSDLKDPSSATDQTITSFPGIGSESPLVFDSVTNTLYTVVVSSATPALYSLSLAGSGNQFVDVSSNDGFSIVPSYEVIVNNNLAVNQTTGKVYVPSNGSVVVLETPPPGNTTTTTLTASASSITSGASVTLTAAVTDANGPVTDGTVTFSDNGTSLGSSVALGAQGTAQLTTTTLPVGSDSIVASYSGGSATNDNSSNSPPVTITVTAAPPQFPVATLTPLLLSFGSQTTGVASAAQSVTLSNTGNAPLSITGIAVMGANASDFTETNNCGASLAASATCTINIVFDPTAAAGTETATLNVADNATGTPQQVALSGLSTPANVSCTVPSVSVSNDVGSITITCNSNGYIGTMNFAITLPSPLSQYITATFSPTSIDFTSTISTGTTVLTIAPVSSSVKNLDPPLSRRFEDRLALASLILMPGWWLVSRKRRPRSLHLLLLIAGFISCALVSACGGGSPKLATPPAGSYSASIVLTGPGLNQTIPLTIQVK
jgi:hypothetical protein